MLAGDFVWHSVNGFASPVLSSDGSWGCGLQRPVWRLRECSYLAICGGESDRAAPLSPVLASWFSCLCLRVCGVVPWFHVGCISGVWWGVLVCPMPLVGWTIFSERFLVPRVSLEGNWLSLFSFWDLV